VYVFWGGREGAESAATKRVADALERYREAIDFLCGYVRDRGYEIRFAIEPKPNEPRGEIFLPTVGHALHFITTLDDPDMVGVNPEVAHETMAGLSFVHAVSQALWAGKLFHIDLNGQRIGRYDQDFRFGAEDLKEAFLLVHLLETSGYDGVRHFDAHAYRSEDEEGVWDFASGCMRTYLALAAKSRQFLDSEAIRAAREAARVDELTVPSVGPFSPEAASALLDESRDLDPLARHGYANERLDQLVVELLLGSAAG
jgi:xylose isomerase